MPDAADPGPELPYSYHPYVVNDLVIREDNCNLACDYCLTGQSQFHDDHDLQRVFDPPRPDSCEPGSELRERLDTIVDATQQYDVPVVKISGGEATLLRGIMDYIETLSESHETVVLLTNGLLVRPHHIARMEALGNVVLQISLDSVRYEGNRYRAESPKVHAAIINRLYPILESRLPVEIYMVLNDRSIEEIEATFEELTSSACRDVVVYPFPVRGPESERFACRTDQHRHVRRVMERAAEFESLLPTPAYMDRLWQFLTEGTRSFGCHLPRIAFTTFDDGTMTSCPNIWFNQVGNLVDEPGAEVLDRSTRGRFRDLLLTDLPRLDACKGCYTPWDPVTLYFEDIISLETLSEVPLYRGARAQNRLKYLHDIYVQAPTTDASNENTRGNALAEDTLSPEPSPPIADDLRLPVLDTPPSDPSLS